MGKDLGVRYVLQGNVQRGGEKIRINAQLADTSSGGQLWAETFDGDSSDLFALQDRITSRIANSIGREIVVAAARESEARKTDPQAGDLLLRAVALTIKTRDSGNPATTGKTLSRDFSAGPQQRRCHGAPGNLPDEPKTSIYQRAGATSR